MRPPALGLLAALALAGCANQPCDPNVDNNIFQVGRCVAGGGYQQRVDTLQARLQQAEAEQATAQRQADEARARRDRAAAEQAQLRADLAAERARATRLERDIATARERGRVDRERLAQLEGELGRLQAEQEQLRNAAPGEALRRRHEDLSRQRQAIEGTLSNLNRSAQRE
jgi:chromosome segregation ATPase